ncbi:MAG: M1 family metallopeptidase [Acidimicrobiia bacterium]|nr:MAG: M1 family metallopeptidase [Acidimicrobiia bacterium]
MYASFVVLALVAVACGPTTTTTTTTTNTTLPPTSATPTTTTTATTATTAAPVSTVGAAGIGDDYYPTLGNGGYDVEHYELDLFYDPDENMLDAAVILTAVATQDLTAFNLDFAGFDIVDLRVGDLPATFERNAGELTITPKIPIAAGERFDVTVAYAGNPGPAASAAFPNLATGWQEGPDGEQYVIAEPDTAHTWFPSNDHPLDKATFSFFVTVPDGYAVAVTGEFLGTELGHRTGETLTYAWEMSTPMAPYLATIVIGEGYQLVDDPVSTEAAGIPIRNFLPPDLVANPPDALDDTGEMLTALEQAFGPYPFDRYGIAVVGGFPAALENQTLSVFGRSMVEAPFFEFVLVHELAHQWFGNSVSVAQWSDIWLTEGFATYSELVWIEHRQGRAAYDRVVADRRRAATTAGYPPPGLPPPSNLFNGGVYQLGGLLLVDLRDEIGDDAFFTLLRTYAAEFADGNATTEDFIALAEDISGQDLDEFFQVRLYEPL